MAAPMPAQHGPPTSASVTTRLDYNPLIPAQTQVQVSSLSVPVGANLVFDRTLGQHIFVQATPGGSVAVAPITETQKQSVRWLVEHVPTASLAVRGSRVLARRYADGYYYLATIGSPSSDSQGNFIIEFDENVSNLRMQKTNWFDLIALNDAMCHTIQPGDCCLAPFEKGGTRWAPGRVIEGNDFDRIGASLRLNGTPYEKDTRILVQFGKNVTKTVKSSKCVWLPQVVYERLCGECGRPGRRDERTSHTTDGNKNLNLISYSDVPILPMPTINWAMGMPVWNYCQPVMWQGMSYIPTYPHVWHQSFWPHQVDATVAVHSSLPQSQHSESLEHSRPHTPENGARDTQNLLAQMQNADISCSEDEEVCAAVREVNTELEIWRKKRELKRALKKKVQESGVDLSSSSSSSSSDSESDIDELTMKPLALPPLLGREMKDAQVQISCGPRPVAKRYVRKLVDKKPAWIKYWNHGASKYQANLPKVELSDGHKIHPAGATRYNNEEGRVYVGEMKASAHMRHTHNKVASEERAKVQLQQARERRVLNRLQADLAREIGDSYPSAAVFSYNNSGDVFQHKPSAPPADLVDTKVGATQTMRNTAAQINPAQNNYSIGNQTFMEKTVAVQVD